jgi:hypothetical protein
MQKKRRRKSHAWAPLKSSQEQKEAGAPKKQLT